MFAHLQSRVDNFIDESNKINNRQEPKQVIKLFYDSKNIERIQRSLKKEVYNRTGLAVDYQDGNSLKMIMDGIAQNYEYRLDKSIIENLVELNRRVLVYITEPVAVKAKLEYKYQNELGQPVKHIPKAKAIKKKSLKYF